MSCENLRALLPDLLDGLLDAEEAARVNRHREKCAACGEYARDLERRRSVLYARPEVGSPPHRLRESILAAARPRRPWVPALIRYAAVFLAGVVATLAFAPEPKQVRVPEQPAVVESPAPSELPVIEVASPRVPRRIR